MYPSPGMILQVPSATHKSWCIAHGLYLEIIVPPVSHQQCHCLYISWFMSFSGSLKVNPHTIFNVTWICDFKLLSYVIISFFFVETNQKDKKTTTAFRMSSFQLNSSQRSIKKVTNWITGDHRRFVSPGLLRGELMEKRGVRKCLVRMAPYCRAQRSEVWGWAGCSFFQTWWEYTGKMMMKTNSRWWQLKYFWNFHPEPWGNDPIWLIVLFKLVETTN